MARLRRFLLENQCYHVITVTRNREPVFSNPAHATVLEEALQFVRRGRAYVLAYAIIPDHLHAVLVPRAPYSISQVMQTIKGYTSRVVNARLDHRSPLWQRSFFDRMMRSEEQLRETVEYTHANPVSAGLVEDPATYPFGSAKPNAGVDLEEFLDRGRG